MLKKYITAFQKHNKKYKLSYWIIGVFFVIWMLFLDTNSWLSHRKYNQDIDQLNAQKQKLLEAIEKDQAFIEKLNHPDSLEKFGREEYGLKKEEETLFIIEE